MTATFTRPNMVVRAVEDEIGVRGARCPLALPPLPVGSKPREELAKLIEILHVVMLVKCGGGGQMRRPYGRSNLAVAHSSR